MHKKPPSRFILGDLHSNMSLSDLPSRAFPVSPIAGNIRFSRPGSGVSSVALSETDSGRVRNEGFAPGSRVEVFPAEATRTQPEVTAGSEAKPPPLAVQEAAPPQWSCRSEIAPVGRT